MANLLSAIPRFGYQDIFTLLEEYGTVEELACATAEQLYERYYRLMLYIHSGQAGTAFEPSGNRSLAYWIGVHCAMGLFNLGVSYDAMTKTFASIKDRAKGDLASMARTEDPAWGYYIYDQPIRFL